MATTVHAATSTPADLRRATRIFAALIVPLGPALVAALRYVLPYQTNDEASAAVRAVAADPDRQSVVVWLGFLAMLALLPGVLFVARVARRHAPRLTAAAILLLVPGYTAFGLLVAGDAATWYGATHGLPESAVIDLYNGAHPVILVSTGVFVVGHVLGTVLLGIALLRGNAVPAAAAWLVIVAQPLHFVAAIVVGSHELDLVAWGANAVGFAAVSLAILRMSNDDWELR